MDFVYAKPGDRLDGQANEENSSPAGLVLGFVSSRNRPFDTARDVFTAYTRDL